MKPYINLRSSIGIRRTNVIICSLLTSTLISAEKAEINIASPANEEYSIVARSSYNSTDSTSSLSSLGVGDTNSNFASDKDKAGKCQSNVKANDDFWIDESVIQIVHVYFKLGYGLPADNITSMSFSDEDGNAYEIIKNDAKGGYDVNNLLPNKSYTLTLNYIDANSVSCSCKFDFNTPNIWATVETTVDSRHGWYILPTSIVAKVRLGTYDSSLSQVPIKFGLKTKDGSIGISEEVVNEKEKTVSINGLKPNHGYYVSPFVMIGDNMYDLGDSYYVYACTEDVDYKYDITPGLTSFTIKDVRTTSDKYFHPTSYSVDYASEIIWKSGDKPKTFGKFLPDHTYQLRITAYYDDEVADTETIELKTLSLINKLNLTCDGPTVMIWNAELEDISQEDIRIVKTYYSSDPKTNTLTLVKTGLQPGITWHEETFNVDATVRGYPITNYASQKSMGGQIVFENLKPKAVSDGCVIVGAKTNISARETNIGFQWKRFDAPDNLTPSEAEAVVYDGKMEGYIKNLKSDSYYNVRPFYKDNQGNYYYGEWIAFDPSDFSFFEPTVGMYDIIEITSSSATLSGYTLNGSEEIIRQGFEYWQKDDTRATNSDRQVIECNGIRMTATVGDLNSNSEYHVRAFAETCSGITYSKTVEFTTPSASEVEIMIDSESERVDIVGIYNISGQRFNQLQKGLNIIVYSNGTTKKIIN